VAVALAFVLLGSTTSSASTHTDAQTAAVDLAHKAADLLTLNALTAGGPGAQQPAGAPSAQPGGTQTTQGGGQAVDASSALSDALAGLPLQTPSSRAELLSDLAARDAAAARALPRLQSDGTTTVSREVRAALTPLTSAQLATVNKGGTLATPSSGVLLEALADLTARDGGPTTTTGSPPDPQQVNAALARDLSQSSAVASSSHLWVWIVGAVLAVAAAGTASRGLFQRPRRAARPGPLVLPSQLQHAGPSPAAVQAVLDASRRLTMLPAGDDIPRAVVREALALAPSRAAALVERRGQELVLVHESQPGLLIPTGFHGGVVEQAANTGQPVARLVSADPSFARQPVQALLLPLLSAGRVDAVVVLVRDFSETFTTAERELLATFASVAATARESASRTQAAVNASLIDPLTGVGNRRQLDMQLPVVLNEAGGSPTGFCMVDLDHFKSVNDTYGHPAGDALLREVCATIRAAVRPTDGVYRYGGEEFCILLPATSLAEAQETAERVRRAIADRGFDIGGGQTLTATASLGVAVTTGGDPAALVHDADTALYAAKAGGRNQVRVG
jgi:diguanylate cyclase (GGDEF)-like protein